MSGWWLLVPAAVALYVLLGPWPHETRPVDAEETVAAQSARGTIARAGGASIIHLSPVVTEAETIEFPIVDGWDADSILSCVAEIEAL